MAYETGKREPRIVFGSPMRGRGKKKETIKEAGER